MQLLDKEEFINAVKLKKYNLEFSAGLLMKLLSLDKLNKLYSDAYSDTALGFVNKALDNLKIQVELSENEIARIPKEGSFIMVSNHPFGLLDGIIMIKILKQVRPDAKVMANFLLQKIEPLKDDFFPVNPFENADLKNNLKGIRQCLNHLKEGKPLGIFPAGEVSTKYKGTRKIADREWQTTAIRLIRKAGVPVVPMHFAGANSQLFHLLGKIHPLLRTAQIPSELFTKRNSKILLKVGNPISLKEQLDFENDELFARFLRAKTYALGTEINLKRFFIPQINFPKKAEKIIDAVDPTLISNEVNHLPDSAIMCTQKNIRVYVAAAKEIPNCLTEIGRLREITFREVGEGTNQSVDLDEFDLYYMHLFLWDTEAQCIAGAYRVGKGDEIFESYGRKGFYTQSLFKYKEGFYPILQQSVELGRSFIVKAYQQKPLSLFILWRGILTFLLQNQQFRYIIGPVTISNEYRGISKWLIIEFIKKYYYDDELAQMVKARTEFEVKRKDRDDKILDAINFSDIKYLDKLIAELEPKENKVPVLLKKYLKQNAKIIAFNIDPKFNNALDGLMILDMENLPQGTIDKLKSEMKEQSNSLS